MYVYETCQCRVCSTGRIYTLQWIDVCLGISQNSKLIESESIRFFLVISIGISIVTTESSYQVKLSENLSLQSQRSWLA